MTESTATSTLTPKALAESIGVDPKSLRGYLRKHYPRPIEAKNTSWLVEADAAEAARVHFAKQSTDAATDAPEVETPDEA